MEFPTAFSLATQWLLGVVLIFSVSSKMRHPARFASVVMDYQVLPPQLATAFAYLIIPTEGFLAAALFLGAYTRLSLIVTGVLFAIYLVAAGINVQRGRHIACGCFRGREPVSLVTVVRLLLLISLIGICFALTMGTELRATFDLVSTTNGRVIAIAVVLDVIVYSVGLWALLATRLATSRGR